MSFLFKPTHAKLAAGDREVVIEPVFSICIDETGWHSVGLYKILDHMAEIGRIRFEGNQWEYQGNQLNETEQEELAYFIRFYDGKAA